MVPSPATIERSHRRKLLAAIAALKTEATSSLAANGSDGQSPTLESADTPRPTDAERRQLTVMFCDLVGSTALSAQLDAEELSNVLGAFQKACVGAVTGFGGSVAKYGRWSARTFDPAPRAHYHYL
jgi:class 3 adenylate cyclase